ncbi:hypothetical protein EVG20_g7266 [Dentipellis fragilis]|uniref:Uncharacterized protein n=1 Tax=Dentipellis fragilis TaxID=205917 RepID=A0A4Y9YHC6_9AGAM|nr:hypothetical protein EVG20_g7266 [Dentipellis fragilis]
MRPIKSKSKSNTSTTFSSTPTSISPASLLLPPPTSRSQPHHLRTNHLQHLHQHAHRSLMQHLPLPLVTCPFPQRLYALALPPQDGCPLTVRSRSGLRVCAGGGSGAAASGGRA